MSQLSYLVHKIRTCWGKGKIAQRVFLDISSAFDRVWHKGIIEKLEQIEISNIALDLFTNYLSNVLLLMASNQILNIEAGPLLFIKYINVFFYKKPLYKKVRLKN